MKIEEITLENGDGIQLVPICKDGTNRVSHIFPDAKTSTACQRCGVRVSGIEMVAELKGNNKRMIEEMQKTCKTKEERLLVLCRYVEKFVPCLTEAEREIKDIIE